MEETYLAATKVAKIANLILSGRRIFSSGTQWTWELFAYFYICLFDTNKVLLQYIQLLPQFGAHVFTKFVPVRGRYFFLRVRGLSFTLTCNGLVSAAVSMHG